jgi:type IV pilus assembly protein PilO
MALDINLDAIKKMPPKKKAMAVAVIYLLLAAAYYVVFMQAAVMNKNSLETKLSELQGQVTEKERLAAQKNKYIRELKERQEKLRVALTKLPDEREIPGLLYAVAQAGRDVGVNFILFAPKPVEKKPPEKDKKPADKKPAETKTAAGKPGDKKADGKDNATDEKFYEEIPVDVAVIGSFQNTALFFEKVARLPRIINIQDIAMSGTDARLSKERGHPISTACIIKTYMFLEKMSEKKADEKK